MKKEFGECSILVTAAGIGLYVDFLEMTDLEMRRLIDVNFNESYRDGYNVWCENITEQTMMFIRYHYLCERFDTPYWRESFKMPVPESLKKILNEEIEKTTKVMAVKPIN